MVYGPFIANLKVIHDLIMYVNHSLVATNMVSFRIMWYGTYGWWWSMLTTLKMVGSQ